MHLCICQAFIECPLYTLACSGHWENRSKQEKTCPLCNTFYRPLKGTLCVCVHVILNFFLYHMLYLNNLNRNQKSRRGRGREKPKAELVGLDFKEELQRSGQAEQVRNPERLPGGRWSGTKPRATTCADVGEMRKGEAWVWWRWRDHVLTFLPGGLLLCHLSLHHADYPVLPRSDAAWCQGRHPLLHHTQLPQAVRLRGERPSWPPVLEGTGWVKSRLESWATVYQL